MRESETNTNRGIVLTLPILRLMNPIEGWLGENEADLLIATTWKALSELSLSCARTGTSHCPYREMTGKALSELSPPNAVVEIGSYCGRSTVVLASVVRALCAQTKVYAIDPHTGEVGSQDKGLYNTMPTGEKFRQNIANAGLADVVELIPKYSFEVPWDQPIGLLLIDGLHDYTNVSRDFYHFEPWLVPGAYISFHDYANYYPGVKRFVDEILGSGHYQKIHCAESMIVVQKRAL